MKRKYKINAPANKLAPIVFATDTQTVPFQALGKGMYLPEKIERSRNLAVITTRHGGKKQLATDK